VATPLLPCIHVLAELLGHVRAELDHFSGFAVASESFDRLDALPHLEIIADRVLSEARKFPRAELLAGDASVHRGAVQLQPIQGEKAPEMAA
jgi:hypothetical protein